MAVETGERPEVGFAYSRAYDMSIPPVDPDRITTLDGAGARASGDSALGRPPHNGADEYKFATYMNGMFDVASTLRESVAEARRRCTAGGDSRSPPSVSVVGRLDVLEATST